MEPSFYSEGTTPLPTDTRLKIWTKILGRFQNAAGAEASNNPGREDTLWRILYKLAKAAGGSPHRNDSENSLAKRIYRAIVASGGGSSLTNVFTYHGKPDGHVTATGDAIALTLMEGFVRVWIKFTPGVSNVEWVYQSNLAGQCCAQACDAPEAPSTLVVGGAGPIDINWTLNSTNETSVEVWVSVNGADFSLLASNPAGTDGQEDNSGYASGDQMCYKVRACNSCGCSDFSNTDCVAFCEVETPANAAVNGTQVTWQASHDPVVGFVINYGHTAGGPYDHSVTASPTDRSHNFNGLGVGTWYFVIVANDGNDCLSTDSEEVTMTI